MPNHALSSDAARRRSLAWRAIVCAVLFAAAITARPLFARAVDLLTLTQGGPGEVSRVIPANTDRVLLLVMNPLGFDVESVTMQAGRHHLVVRNTAALQDADVTLTVRRADADRPHAAVTVRDRENKYFDLDLAPGEYVVSAHSREIRVSVVP
jgi:hypothetical protein